MAPHSLHGRKKRVAPKTTIKWSYQMRMAVHLLYTDFDFSAESRARLFTTLFKEELRAYGIESVRSTTINSQYSERLKSDKPHWNIICAPSANMHTTLLRVVLQTRIQEAAHLLKLPVVLKGKGKPRAQNGTKAVTRWPLVKSDGGDNMIEGKESSVSPPMREKATADITSHIPPEQRSRIGFLELPPFQQFIQQEGNRQNRSILSTPSPAQRRKIVTPQRLKPHKIPFLRNDGSTILISPKQYASMQEEEVAVTEHSAHPPTTGLLFRYWLERQPLDHDSYNGFVARKYFNNRFWPKQPPPSYCIDVTDVGNHMNRDIEKTPFVSTSVRLVWIFRSALKDLKLGIRNGRISVIDASALDPKSVFYARPFHAEPKKQCGFTDGKQRYPGTSEFLIWRNIPGSALIHTFKASDLYAQFSESTDGSGLIGDLLQLRSLMLPRSSLTKLVLGFRARQNVLTNNLVAQLTSLVIFLGLTVRSPYEHIAHVVSDVIQGWGVKITYQDDWSSLANVFFRSLCERTGEMAIEEHYKIAFAFLHGVHWGSGDLNARHDQVKTANVTRKAAAVGLRSPAEILARDADIAKKKSRLLEEAHDYRIQTYHASQHHLVTSSQPRIAASGLLSARDSWDTAAKTSIDGFRGDSEDETSIVYED